MANYFNLTLDTIGPASPRVNINTGATYSTSALVNLTISTEDSSTSGYQVKIWGHIDIAWAKTNGLVSNTATAVNESDALWLSFVASKQVQLASPDGSKTVYIKLRDDVYNESAQASDSITLDTTKPIVNITGPDVSMISKISGKDTASFSFSSSESFVEYKVKVVSATGALENTGTQIPVTAGSTNMSATGDFAASTPINCTIKGADLEAASSGDNAKIVKVFVKDTAGNWSV